MADLYQEIYDANGSTLNNGPAVRAVTERAEAEIERLRDTINCCIVAMRSAQQSKYPTDWTSMIAGLEATVQQSVGDKCIEGQAMTD